jgi:hypothetical protein
MTTMAAASPLTHGCWAAKNPTVTARYTALLNRASVTVPHFDERIFNIAGRTCRTQNARKSGQQHGWGPSSASQDLPARVNKDAVMPPQAAAADGVR